MKQALKQMQYRFAVIYETLSIYCVMTYLLDGHFIVLDMLGEKVTLNYYFG